MTRLRWITAGESHGPGCLAVLEGIPAGLVLDVGRIDGELRRRQGGYGRGKRMDLEMDRVRILGGVKRGRTLGSPIAIFVENRDVRIDEYRKLTRPRPGHADLAGAWKYGTADCADVMERASARETASRVAAGAVAAQVLGAVGIEVLAWVSAIGEVDLEGFEGGRGWVDPASRRLIRERSPFYSLAPDADAEAAAAVDRAREAGDSLGGFIRIEASGVPPGLGSPMQWDLRLDGRLAGALMAIQAIKAVEIGAGVRAAAARGREFQDPILRDGVGVRRPSNHAGGLEGGMSNGEPIRIRLAMKPIPSVRRPLPSVDLETGAGAEAVYERSDVCAVPAASVVAEAVTALVLLEALLEKTGGDSMAEVVRNLAAWRSGRLPAAQA